MKMILPQYSHYYHLPLQLCPHLHQKLDNTILACSNSQYQFYTIRVKLLSTSWNNFSCKYLYVNWNHIIKWSRSTESDYSEKCSNYYFSLWLRASTYTFSEAVEVLCRNPDNTNCTLLLIWRLFLSGSEGTLGSVFSRESDSTMSTNVCSSVRSSVCKTP